MSHTDAPWAAQAYALDGTIHIVHEYETPDRGPGREVAGIAVVSFAGVHTEDNARLIAAAPDLLAAGVDLLECLFNVLGEPSDDPFEPRSRGADAAYRLRAAIDKARGEAVPS